MALLKSPECKKANCDSAGSYSHGAPGDILLPLLVVLSVCGTGFILWTTSSYGTGITPDSVWFISCARNLVAGKGYTIFTGYNYMAWPPLFPTLLAALHLAGIDPLVGARFLNAFIYGLIVFTSGLLFIKTIRNTSLLLFGFFLIVFSSSLLHVCSQAWTEPLFILLTVLSVLYLAQFLRNQRWFSLLLFSCCAALACLERYIGITVVLTGCTAILLFMRNCTIFKRFQYAACSACFSLGPLALWCLRNYSLNSTLTGGRSSGGLPVIWNIWICISAFSEWFIPDILPPSLTKAQVLVNGISGIAIVLMFFRLKEASTLRHSAKTLLAAYGFIAIFLFFLCKNLALCFIPHLVPQFMNVPLQINIALGAGLLALFFWLRCGHSPGHSEQERQVAHIFIVVYVSFLVISASKVGFDQINDRLLCPVYVFLVCAALAAFDSLAALSGQKHTRYTWLAGALMALWFMSWPCHTSLTMMARQHNSGTIFSNLQLKQSPLLEWLRRNPLQGTSYCNAPWLVYITTGVQSLESTSKPHNLKIFNKSFTPSEPVYLIWYTKNPEGAPLYTPHELESQLPVEAVKLFPDGAVLRLKH